MFLRVLNRLEEDLISVLMSAAVAIIFITVLQRYSVGLLADLVSWARRNDYPGLSGVARSTYRTLVGVNLLWAQELCIYLFVWMAKFGAAYGVRVGIHVGVDVLVNAVSPANRRRLVVVSLLAGALFTGIVAWIGGDFTYHIYLAGQVSADLEIKMWIVYLAVPVGSALMCFRFLQVLASFLRGNPLPHHTHGGLAAADIQGGAVSAGDKA